MKKCVLVGGNLLLAVAFVACNKPDVGGEGVISESLKELDTTLEYGNDK